MKEQDNSDPFLYGVNVIQRLLEEYKKHGSLIIGFDFDNTIYDYHNKGTAYPIVTKLLQDCSKYFELACYTGNSDLELVKSHCQSLGIRIDYLNSSPISVSKPHKPYFSILLDDRAGLLSAVTCLIIVLDTVQKEKDTECKTCQ